MRPKPDPLPDVLGAAKLGLDPGRCVAFEESPAGARAGKAAGCFVVGLHDPSMGGGLIPRAALEAVPCDLIVADFEDPALWTLLEGVV